MLPPPNDSSRAPTIEQARWFSEEVYSQDSQLRAFLRSSFPSLRDVDDLVQESYLRLWRRQLCAPLRSARAFLYKIARHLAIYTLRHRTSSPLIEVADWAELSVVDGTPDAADVACTNEELAFLLEAIDALPPRCREIVILRKLHGLPQKEIARRMGITERTVEVQGTKGLDRCERFLRRRGVRHP